MSFPPSASLSQLDILSILFSGTNEVYTNLFDLNPLAPTYSIKPKRRVAYIDVKGLDVLGKDHPDRGSDAEKCVWKGKFLPGYYLSRHGAANLPSIDLTQQPDIVVKFARGLGARERLLKEFDIYDNQLKNFQGIVVPKCYGIYGSAQKRPGNVLTCLVLQQLPHVEVPDDENHKFRVAKINAIKMLVAEGVIHGSISDPNHFLPTKDKGVYGAYVLSFSNAKIINPEFLQIVPASPASSEETSDESMAGTEYSTLSTVILPK